MTDGTTSQEEVLVPEELIGTLTASIGPVIGEQVQELIDMISSTNGEWEKWGRRGAEGYAARELGVMAPTIYAIGIGMTMAKMVGGEKSPPEYLSRFALELSGKLNKPAEDLKQMVDAGNPNEAKIDFIRAAATVLGRMIVKAELA